MPNQIQATWWNIVYSVASYVALGHQETELFDGEMRHLLLAEGHDPKDVDAALDWLEQAAMSGSLTEVLNILQPYTPFPRIANLLEQVCLSDEMWKQIEGIRQRGILSADLVERLLEGIRTLDTRDWDDEEVIQLVQDVMASSYPGATEEQLRELLLGNDPNFYS